jgi:hypothetical protein
MTTSGPRLAAACFAALLAVACRQNPGEPQAASIASVVHLGDPKNADQLVSGFYGIEAKTWRWTGQKFSALLHPPAGSAQKGATLVLSFTVGQQTIDRLKDITLSASIAGSMLAPQTYTAAGPSTYIREVPPSLLGTSSVQVDFQLDRVLPPTGADSRSLGIIASIIGLEPK